MKKIRQNSIARLILAHASFIAKRKKDNSNILIIIVRTMLSNVYASTECKQRNEFFWGWEAMHAMRLLNFCFLLGKNYKDAMHTVIIKLVFKTTSSSYSLLQFDILYYSSGRIMNCIMWYDDLMWWWWETRSTWRMDEENLTSRYGWCDVCLVIN